MDMQKDRQRAFQVELAHQTRYKKIYCLAYISPAAKTYYIDNIMAHLRHQRELLAGIVVH